MRDDLFCNLYKAVGVPLMSLGGPGTVVLWYCGALMMWCCAHFNEMTAKLMRNAKNPVSRLQFGLKVHFSLYLLRARYVLRCHNGSHLQV